MATSNKILNSLDQNSQGPRTKEQDEQDLKSQQGSYLKRELLIANMLIAAKDMLKKLLDAMFVQQKALENRNLLESDTSNNNQLQVDKMTKPIINPQIAIINALLLQWKTALAAITTILQNSPFSWKTIQAVHNNTQLQQQHNVANNQIFINLLNLFQTNNNLNLKPIQITELQNNFNHKQNMRPTLVQEFEFYFQQQKIKDDIAQITIKQIIRTFVMQPILNVEREFIEMFMDTYPGMSYDVAKLEVRRLMQKGFDEAAIEQRVEELFGMFPPEVLAELFKQFQLGHNAQFVVNTAHTTMQQISEQIQIINQVQYQLSNKNISLTQEQFNNLQPLVNQTNQFVDSSSSLVPRPQFSGQKKDELNFPEYYNLPHNPEYNSPYNPEFNPNDNLNNPPYNPEYNPNDNLNNPPYNPEYNPNDNPNNPPYNPEFNPNDNPNNPPYNPEYNQKDNSNNPPDNPVVTPKPEGEEPKKTLSKLPTPSPGGSSSSGL